MIEIYGKSGCNYCSQLQQLLKIKRIQFSYTDIAEAGIDSNELSRICEGNIVKTLPQVLDEGVYIGGYRDAIAHIFG